MAHGPAGADDGFLLRVDPIECERESGFVFRGDPCDGVPADQSPRRGLGPPVQFRLGHQSAIGDHSGHILGVAVSRIVEFEGQVLLAFEFHGDGFEVAHLHAKKGINGSMTSENFSSLLRAEGFELRHDVVEFHGR